MRDGRTRALRHLAPLAAAFALACALLAPAQEVERGKKQEAPADSDVHGRVVYDDTGRPVRRARVLLVDEAASRPAYSTLTDGEGAFRIKGVRAGSYLAFVNVPGVLSPVSFIRLGETGGRDAPDLTEARKFFDAVEVDGKQDARLTVRARRGAALSGRVSYADGDPAVNVTVTLMRRGRGGKLEKFLAGVSIASLASLKTDDRGVYRMTGLPPGEYVIAVSEQAEHGDGGSAGGMRDPAEGVFESLAGQQFLMTFYPSATRVKDAAVVKAEAGVERPDLDVTIPERALYTVGGIVRGRSDKLPVANATVKIESREEGAGADADFAPERSTGNNSTKTDAEGRWEFRQLPEGSYTVAVKPPDENEREPPVTDADDADGDELAAAVARGGRAPRPRKKNKGYAPARRDLEVIESDLADVAVELNDGARVSGTVSYEGGRKAGSGYFKLRRVSAGAADDEDSEGSGGSWNSYTDDDRFDVTGLPAGKYVVQFGGYSEEGRVYAKSMTWNGRDLMREPLELGEGAAVEGVRVVVSSQVSKLRVRARGGARGAASRGFNVALVPPDASGWSPYAQQYSCYVGEDGACEIDAPPGEYRVVAIRVSAAAGSYEEEFGRRATTAPRVTLAAGETKDFEVSPPPEK